jgi:hypothetical protein
MRIYNIFLILSILCFLWAWANPILKLYLLLFGTFFFLIGFFWWTVHKEEIGLKEVEEIDN